MTNYVTTAWAGDDKAVADAAADLATQLNTVVSTKVIHASGITPTTNGKGVPWAVYDT